MNSERIESVLLGRGAGGSMDLKGLVEAVLGKQLETPAPQSEEIVAEAEKGRLSYVPFPYGLDPSALADLYHSEPTHHACCALKARAILANEWHLVRVDGVPAKPPEDLLARLDQVFPDGLDSVIYPAALDYEVLGNAYLEVVRKPDPRYPPGLGPIGRVVHVPAFSVRRLPPDHPTGCAYVQIYRGEEVYFREYGAEGPLELKGQGYVTELIHVKNLSGQSASNYWYGIPDIIAALPALYGLKKAMEYLSAHLAAKGVPNYMLILQGAGSSPDAIDYPTINRYFNEILERGPGKILVIPTPPSVEASIQALTLGFNPREIIEFIHECRDQIARAHGVPLRLLSILEAGQLGSTGEAQAQLEFFRRYVVKPRQAMWENIITRLVNWERAAWTEWKVAFGEITLEDILRQAQADAFGVRFGFLTPNEARLRRGLEPKPGGDELLLLAGGEPVRLTDLLPYEPAEPEGGEEKQNSRPGLRIQSLLLAKERFKTLKRALRWVLRHDFRGENVDETEEYFRFRQFEPGLCEEGSFRTIELTDGVKAVVCRPRFPNVE